MQGFNMGRYYPPDASNPPTFNSSSHPLGKRASKISKGILTVRFELPFAVWCDHCTPPAIIGQGVRFNAEKKKVGNYYSTPIWSFRMKHSACGGWWEIRTDPKNAAYVVVEGARKRDYGDGEKGAEGEEGGEMRFLTEEEREKRRGDAFAGFEGKMEEKGSEKRNRERVEELYEKSEVWRDPYEVNARLRREFRGKRKVWKKEERYKEGMQDKFSLGMDIVDETEGDRMRAGLIEFGADTNGEKKFEGLSWKPLFAEKVIENHSQSAPKTKKIKAEMAAAKSRQSLQHSLVGNTRAAVDPFLAKDGGTQNRVNLGLLKRKRNNDAEDPPKNEPLTLVGTAACETSTKKPAIMPALVDYDSE